MSEEPINQTNNKPDYLVYSVQGQGRSALWIKIGAAWTNKDGEGISIDLNALPFNFDGRLILRQPKNQD